MTLSAGCANTTQVPESTRLFRHAALPIESILKAYCHCVAALRPQSSREGVVDRIEACANICPIQLKCASPTRFSHGFEV